MGRTPPRRINNHSWEQVQLPVATPKRSSTPLRIALVVVPALIALLFWSSGRHTMAVVVGTMGGAVGALSFTAPTTHAALLGVLTWLGASLGSAITLVVLAILWVLVFTPASLLSRIRGLDPLARASDPRCPTYWNVVPRYRRSLIERLYAFEPASRLDGTARRALIPRIFTAALFLIVLNYVVGFAISVRTSRMKAEAEEWQEIANKWVKFYPNAPWAKDLAPDHQACIRGSRTHAYIVFYLADCDRPTVHIEDKMRRTIVRAGANDPAVATVWFFGGSTMYGWGARDEDTLPSRFVEHAEKRGLPVKVANFGTPTYVTWQEIQLFEQKLASGEKPDLAIFYDGYNDLMRVWFTNNVEDDFVGVTDGFLDQLRAKDRDIYAPLIDHSAIHYLYRRFTESSAPPPPLAPDAVETRANAVARAYFKAYEHVQRLARVYDVPVVNVWQPIRALQPALMDLERDSDEESFPGMKDGYARATDLVAQRGPVLMIHEVKGNTKPVWLDSVHLTGEGNAIVAASILDRVAPALQQIVDAKRARLSASKVTQ